jgi:hypothetical protein
MPQQPKKTDKLCEQVLDRISKGEPLTHIAKDLKFSVQSWNRWLREDEELAIAHARAREDGGDAIAEEALRLADAVEAKSEHVQKAKLQIETRLKLLAKWHPKRYGDRQTHEVGNVDGEPLKVEHSRASADVLAGLTQRILGPKRDA